MDIDPVYDGARSIRTKTTVNSITPELLAEIIDAIGDALTDAENEKTPNSHAATSTKYGKATASNYGHVLLKDDLTGADALTTASGVAATPAALMALKASLQQLLNNLGDRISDNATYERTERMRMAQGFANLLTTHTSTERTERTQAINNINDTLNQHITAERSERTSAINGVSENFRNSLANLRDAVNGAIEAVNCRLNNHITAGRDDAVDVTNYDRLVSTLYGWQYQGAAYGNKANACGLFCKLSELGITASSIVPSRISFVTREDNTDPAYYRGNVYLRICNTSGQILYHSKNAVNVTGESGQLLEWDIISDTYPRLSTSENLLFLFCSSNDIAAQSVVRIGVGTSARNDYPSNVGLITLQNDKAPTATILSWNNPNRLATFSLANLKITYFISSFDTEELTSLIQAEHETNASQATAITALQTSVQNKVNSSTFNSLQSTVTTMQTTLNGKASTEYVDEKCAEIGGQIPLLFDKSRYADSITLVARHSTAEGWANKWNIPTVNNQYAGLMSKAMYIKFTEMQQTIATQEQQIENLQSALVTYGAIIQPLDVAFTMFGLSGERSMIIQKLTMTGNPTQYTFSVSNGENRILFSPLLYPDLYASDSQGIIVMSEDFGINSCEFLVNNYHSSDYFTTGGEADITINLSESYTRNENIQIILTCTEY